jgi:putative redox protein
MSPGAETVVQVVETGEGPYANRVHAGAHTLRADEPAAAGGRDTGPSPYEWLAGALGACTSITVRMYADRKRWPLDRVRVVVRHRRVHAEDCRDCETKPGHLDRLEREVELTGALDAAQRQRLLEIANRCPVHRTLEAGVAIETRLVEPEARSPR